MSVLQTIQILCVISSFEMTDGQVNGMPESGDPTNQELALLDWTSGIRVFYCADSPLELLVEPFKKALIRSLNKFCKNATACRLTKPVPFTSNQVVLLDGYPRRDYGAVQFRFVVVLPPDAVPMDHLKQPLLTKKILSDFLRSSIKEFERKFGWKVSSYERFPKFDQITEFMNIALIPIGFILLVLMFFLAYWSTRISRSTGGGEGWFVSGSAGGKNTALKRTLEMIEEEKMMDFEKNREKQRRLRAQLVATSSDNTVLDVEGGEKCDADKITDVSRSALETVPLPASSPSTAQSESSAFEDLPSVAFRAPAPSISTQGSATNIRFQSGRRASRRLSSIDEGVYFPVKRHRKVRASGVTRRHPKRHWKSTSMALGGFGKS